MSSGLKNEPGFGAKVKVVTINGVAAHLHNERGEMQFQTEPNGTILSIFEAKEINGQVYYRVGDQKAWLAKADTNYATQLKRDADQYNVSIKNGLVIEQNSPVPGFKGMRKVFKDADSFPKGTTFKWIDAPNTNENKYTNGKIKITFPDGSFKERKVHYLIAHNQAVANKQNFQAKNQSLSRTFNRSGANIKNLPPKDFDFDFLKQNEIMSRFDKNVDETLNLYEQCLYDQMSNTIRKGIEIYVDELMQLNQINPGTSWQMANLSNKLAYVAYLHLLPKRMLDLCFSVKNYGNIGSHYTVASVNQVSALADLRQYHDLLIYLVNAYGYEAWPYADVQITDEQNKHPLWYKKPNINPAGIATYQEYLAYKNDSKGNFNQTQSDQLKNEKLKMGQSMKILISCFVAVGIVIIIGIGYEIYQLANNNSTKTEVVQDKAPTMKEKAANLSVKQLLALSLIYAKRNDDSKFDNNWQGVYDVLSNNNYNVGRYDSYTFGDATVSAQGQNYIYVFEKGIGLGYQDKGNQKLVSFFDADESEPVRVYDYQMLEVVNNLSAVKKLAKKLVFTNESEDY